MCLHKGWWVISQGGALISSGGGGGGGTVTSVTGGIGISVINPTTNPVVSLIVPVSAMNGGTGMSSPTAHTIAIGEGSSPFNFIGPLTNGQLLIGSTGNDPVAASLSAGSGITITPSAGGISIASTVTGGIVTIDGDSGSITGSTVTIKAAGSGSSVKFTNSGTTSTFGVTDANDNVIIGGSAGNATISGTANTGLGFASLFALTSGIDNMAIGYASLDGLLTGGSNIAIGANAGTSYTGAESSNILFNTDGVVGESHVLRIGSTTGTGASQLSKAFISGINGVTSSNPLMVTINSSTDQLGVVATGNNGVLITSASGVPSWLADGTTGQFLAATTAGPPTWSAVAGGITGTTTQFDVIVGAGASSVGSVGPGATGQVLQSGGNAANPAYSTATYPSVGTSTGSILIANGTNWVPTTSTYPSTNAINTLLYASSANVMSALATVTTAVLTTAAGVPTWASNLSLTLGGTNASLTASNGGIFYSTASAGAILAGTATAGQILLSGASTAPIWSTSTYPATNAVSTLLYASSANVMGALATANNGALITSATGVPSILAATTAPGTYLEYTGSAIQFYNPLSEVILQDDFMLGVYNSTQINGTYTWKLVTQNSADNNVPVAGTNNHPGIAQLTTGANAAGAIYMSLGVMGSTGTFVLGNGALDLYFVIQIPVLSTGLQRFSIGVGLGDSTNNTPPLNSNGVYFQYTDNVNSGDWSCIAAKASALTTISTSTVVATTYTTLHISINAAGTSATYYINGVSQGTNSSNLPTTTVCPYVSIGSSVGTTPKLFNIDYFYLYQNMTSTR